MDDRVLLVSMSEFDTRAAAQAIREAGSLDEVLRQRTEGLATAIWGLALPAMFLSFGLIHAEVGHSGSPWLGFLWMPWALVGFVLTSTVWRGARLTQPSLAPSLIDRWLQLGSFVLAYGAAVWLALRISDRMGPETFAMVAVGAIWTVLAVVDLRRSSRLGRLLRVTVGVILFATGIVMARFIPEGGAAAVPVAAAASALVPLAAGLLQAWRA